MDLANCERRRPLRSQDVKADGSVGVDVRVVDPSRERNLTANIFFYNFKH